MPATEVVSYFLTRNSFVAVQHIEYRIFIPFFPRRISSYDFSRSH